ncbi:unnamed protein product [Thelazia callipaeda]|uniref:IgGFc_binding domain-containing protein n=1 Tax=Thelazia callipaeda TaxID=103827 RepID=A0A0N5CPP9_THECL|nr:unnamed protein product [Thelazia callipaeda]
MIFYKVALYLVVVACKDLQAQKIYYGDDHNGPASVGHEFNLIFPKNTINAGQTPVISIVVMNTNLSTVATVRVQYYEVHGEKREPKEITLKINGLSYETVEFNSSSLSTCGEPAANYLTTCIDTTINVYSEEALISVLANWYLPDSGDSFAVTPITMGGYDFRLSIPQPSDAGNSTVYFLPTSQNYTNLVIFGEIDEDPFYLTFNIKPNDSSLITIRTQYSLTLWAVSNCSFTIAAFAEGLAISEKMSKKDFGAFMPTPTIETGCGETLNDYHVFMQLAAERILVTQSPYCIVPFSTYGDSGKSAEYFDPYTSEDIHLSGYGLNAGVNSSLGMLQVLQYGGYNLNETFDGAYLDMAVSWSQFVTGLTTFYVPTDENIVSIIADEDGIAEMYFDMTTQIWNWAPIPYYDESFYFATASVSSGLHTIESYGFYTVFVVGRNNRALYEQVAKDLPEKKTTLPPTTTTTPSTTTSTSSTTPSTTTSSTTPSTTTSTTTTSTTTTSTTSTTTTTSSK